MPVSPIPEGFHTVTPMLMVPNGHKFLDFAQKAFGATIVHKLDDPKNPNKLMHAAIKIGNSIIMLGESNEQMPSVESTLFIYVEDSDTAYKKAVSAGATSTMEPSNQFWGDRASAVKDNFGINWWFGTQVEIVPEAELKKRAATVCDQQQKKAS